jgi:hypothetical protein
MPSTIEVNHCKTTLFFLFFLCQFFGFFFFKSFCFSQQGMLSIKKRPLFSYWADREREREKKTGLNSLVKKN